MVAGPNTTPHLLDADCAYRSSRGPRVVVVGGGGTGVALSYDFALRGYEVLLLERGELTSGTTGRHHGQLHSGARYVVSDREIGAECYRESVILRRIAGDSIEYNAGLFCAIDEADERYLPTFLDGCGDAGIPVRELTAAEATAAEPGLADGLRRFVLVPDGTIDAWRLVCRFAASAVAVGAQIRTWARVTGIETEGGRVAAVVYEDVTTGTVHRERCDVVVNAGGAWAGRIASLAGCTLDVTPSPGTMVAFAGRLTNMVVSRLHPPCDGDIVVPQRLFSIVGSTQRLSDDPDRSDVSVEDVETLREAGARLVPGIANAPIRAAWAAPRPLAGDVRGTTTGPRSLSRGFVSVDHGVSDGVHGLYSIVGGKATVLRLMAETLVDEVSDAFGIDAPCETARYVLRGYCEYLQNRMGTGR